MVNQARLLKQALLDLQKDLDEQYADAWQATLKAIEASEAGEAIKGVDEDEETPQ